MYLSCQLNSSEGVNTDHSESRNHKWWTARVIISLTCLRNHSEADRWRQAMTCRLLHVEQLNVVYETCGHPAIITIAVVSSLSIGSTPVVAKGHIAAVAYPLQQIK